MIPFLAVPGEVIEPGAWPPLPAATTNSIECSPGTPGWAVARRQVVTGRRQVIGRALITPTQVVDKSVAQQRRVGRRHRCQHIRRVGLQIKIRHIRPAQQIHRLHIKTRPAAPSPGTDPAQARPIRESCWSRWTIHCPRPQSSHATVPSRARPGPSTAAERPRHPAAGTKSGCVASTPVSSSTTTMLLPVRSQIIGQRHRVRRNPQDCTRVKSFSIRRGENALDLLRLRQLRHRRQLVRRRVTRRVVEPNGAGSRPVTAAPSAASACPAASAWPGRHRHPQLHYSSATPRSPPPAATNRPA